VVGEAGGLIPIMDAGETDQRTVVATGLERPDASHLDDEWRPAARSQLDGQRELQVR
jgi:hypothetical protein